MPQITVRAQDQAAPPQIATRDLILMVASSASRASLFFVAQPAVTRVGDPINVSVQAFRSNGSPAAGINITIALGSNPGNATLTGTLSAITGTNGIAVFPNLTLNASGTGFTLVAGSPGFTSATSKGFDIIPSGLQPIITNIVPENAAAGHGQLITIQGSGLDPSTARVAFTPRAGAHRWPATSFSCRLRVPMSCT